MMIDQSHPFFERDAIQWDYVQAGSGNRVYPIQMKGHVHWGSGIHNGPGRWYQQIEGVGFTELGPMSRSVYMIGKAEYCYQ